MENTCYQNLSFSLGKMLVSHALSSSTLFAYGWFYDIIQNNPSLRMRAGMLYGATTCLASYTSVTCLNTALNCIFFPQEVPILYQVGLCMSMPLLFKASIYVSELPIILFCKVVRKMIDYYHKPIVSQNLALANQSSSNATYEIGAG